MIDEIYKAMILALPCEFFEGWHWHAGDLAINMDDPYKRKVMILTTSEQIFFKKVIVAELLYPNSMDSVKTTAPFSRLRPVPSQEQLLQIYKTKKGLQSESMSLLWLANWIEDKVAEDHDFCFKYESAEVITLLWVQETCFNQKWDGKEWTENT